MWVKNNVQKLHLNNIVREEIMAIIKVTKKKKSKIIKSY